jgi:ABC-type lipoprotein export system ATPase subunit
MADIPTYAAALADVSMEYRSASGPVQALRSVNAEMAVAAMTAVTGPSGSGKSSMIRLIAGLDVPTCGAVHVLGESMSTMTPRARRRFRRRRIAVVHQRPMWNLITDLDVGQHLDFVCRLRGSAPAAVEPSSVDAVLERFGLGSRRRDMPRQLSGGEQQRLAVAMAVVADTRLIVADEPTAELDRASAAEVINALRDAVNHDRSVIVASHDRDVLAASEHHVRLSFGEVRT